MNYLYLIIILSNLNVWAHSQTPSTFGGKNDKLNSISTKQIKTIPISIQNLNNYGQQYSIWVDKSKVGQTPKLIKNQTYKVTVPVKINIPNKLESHTICTLSMPNNKKEMFRTKICTKALLYWVKQ